MCCRVSVSGHCLSVAAAAVLLHVVAARHGGVTVNENGVVVHNGLPVVPVGAYIYDVTSDGDRAFPAEEASHGINLVAPYISVARNHTDSEWADILAFMDNCSATGVLVHYHLNVLSETPDTPAKWAAIAAEVMRVRDHPALFGYYIADEPGCTKTAMLEKVYRFIKQLDPLHPMTIAFCCCDPGKYVNAFDIGMMDPYPITSIDDNAVNEQRLVSMITGAAATLSASGKPFFIVLQCFGGGEAWQRAPTAAEIKVMAYLAVIHGATGVQYFARSPEDVFPNSPLAWAAVREVALDIAELTPAVAGGKALSPTVSGNTSRVDAAAWAGRSEPGAQYVAVAVANCANAPTAVSIGGLAAPAAAFAAPYTGPAEVVGQNRNVTVVNGVLSDVLLGYGTATYRYPPVAWGTGTASPSEPNLILNPSYELAANAGSPDGDYLGAPSRRLSGASFLADARTSVDGLHSLRLTAPEAGQSYSGGPYPVHLAAGVNYSVSVWAKAKANGTVLNLAPHGLKIDPARSTCGAGSACTLTTEWAKYEAIGVATAATTSSATSYTLATAGVAWLDLLSVQQINDCPNDGSGHGFAAMELPPFPSYPTASALANASRCCGAGWVAGVDFEQICTATEGWFWHFPGTGPYLCCHAG